MARLLKFLLSLFIFAVVCYVGLDAFVDHEVGKEIEQAVAETPGMTLDYSALDVDIFEHTVVLSDVKATLPDGQRFTADAIRISRFDHMNPFPHFVDAEATGLITDTAATTLDTLGMPIPFMGVDTVKSDVVLSYDYDQVSQSLRINTLDIKVDGLGDIKFSGAIDHLDLSEARVEKLVGLRIAEADMVFTNRSFINSLIHGAARSMGTSEDQARATVCKELAAMADYAGRADNEVAENALRGFKRFIDQPGSIAISVRPAEPVPWLYFFMGRDFYDNLRLLNIEVTTDSGDDI